MYIFLGKYNLKWEILDRTPEGKKHILDLNLLNFYLKLYNKVKYFTYSSIFSLLIYCSKQNNTEKTQLIQKYYNSLKGVFTKNERRYRLNAIKKRF